MTLDAFFLPVSGGRMFCLLHEPDEKIAAKGGVIYVHPFAEEMNKSRRMAALQARAMASAGYTVLQVDLPGCGDSSGDFGDASWDGWIEATAQAGSWLQQRTGGRLWWWGLRTGCLLAAEAANRAGHPCMMLLWQPVVVGKQYLQQFLRLKIAGDLLDAGATKGGMDRLRERLAVDGSVEIAGYRLSSALAKGLESAEFVPPVLAQKIDWIAVSSNTEGGMSPLAKSRLEKWQASGVDARGRTVVGPAFWQTTEIAECPELINTSLQMLSEAESQ